MSEAQLQYQQWLRSKQVQVASDLVTTTNDTNLVVAGWGCVAKSDIERGTVLFSIPREACFGAAATDNEDEEDDDADDPTTRDTQMDLAISILQRRQKQKQQCLDNNNNDESNEEDWSPFLNLLTPPPHGLPWTWDHEFRHAMLRGTELERVVESKIKRISTEYEQILKQKEQHGLSSITYQEYVNACEIVASHTNPWFGVSMVPFNTTLNWDKAPNVEFDLEEEEEEEDCPDNNNHSETCQRIVGRATCNIKKGQELVQSYGASVADLVYRYGFAPSSLEDCDGMDGDVVSIDLADILTIAQETKKGKTHRLNSETLNLKTRQQEGREETDNPFASITNIPHLSSRLDALKLSGALDESPWDGLDGHLTAEIARPAQPIQPFLESLRASSESESKNIPKRGGENRTSPMNTVDKLACDDGGLSKLVGTFVVLLADDNAWERASNALQNFNNDIEESRSSGGSEAEGDECSDSDDSRKDDITASLLLSAIFHLSPQQTDVLLQVALDKGAGGNDPWRALLEEICTISTSEHKLKKRKISNDKDTHNTNAPCASSILPTSFSRPRRVQLRVAFEAAMTALLIRRAKIIEGESSCPNVNPDLEAYNSPTERSNGIISSTKGEHEKNKGSHQLNAGAKVQASKTINILRGVEKSILDQAIKILSSMMVEEGSS